jgi:hypothetical protein
MFRQEEDPLLHSGLSVCVLMNEPAGGAMPVADISERRRLGATVEGVAAAWSQRAASRGGARGGQFALEIGIARCLALDAGDGRKQRLRVGMAR